MHLRVAAVQMTSTPHRAENLEKIRAFIERAKADGARLVTFPENCTLLTEGQALRDHAEALTGTTVRQLRAWAQNEKIWVLIGSIPLLAKKKLTNSSLLISPAGVIKARYDKIHLFDVDLPGDRSYRESESFVPGKKIVLAKIAGPSTCRIGLSICYDMRFPELYRALSKMGADIIAIPSAFTVPTGQAHWDVLTKARAIENQCFVIAPAQVGEHFSGRKTYGHTRIIGPWGEILAEHPTGEGIIFANLDFAELKKRRRDLPALEHRRI